MSLRPDLIHQGMFRFRWSSLVSRSSTALWRRTKKWRPIYESLEDRQMFDAALYRSIDGTGNNLLHPDWGSTVEQLLRISPAEYSDGVSSPAGADRPGARAISNALAAHEDEDTPNVRNMSAYVYIWGQFLDHDLDLTDAASPREGFSVAVPTGDPLFDPSSTGIQVTDAPIMAALADNSLAQSRQDADLLSIDARRSVSPRRR